MLTSSKKQYDPGTTVTTCEGQGRLGRAEAAAGPEKGLGGWKAGHGDGQDRWHRHRGHAELSSSRGEFWLQSLTCRLGKEDRVLLATLFTGTPNHLPVLIAMGQ